ncbi:MAG: MFS transporter [Mycolicibacterium sp.]|uniref:MFS transporter n=1 Tax=Mycolicibacterium sp. TaxID=2320850 RepID=UPI003D0FA559
MTSADAGRPEPKGLLVGGIAAGVAGVMADLLSPIYATSFHKGFGLSNTQAGLLVSAALGAMAVVEFGLAHSIGNRNLKRIATYGIVISSVALLYISDVSHRGPGTFWPLLIGMTAVGLGCGLTFVAGNAALSYAYNSERAFGLLTFWYMIFVFVMMTTNPSLRQMYPIVLPYAAMVAVQLICLVLIWWRLPDTRKIAAQHAARAHDVEGSDPGIDREVRRDHPALKLFSAVPILLSLAASLSALALAGVWTFAEDLGETAGLSAQLTASFLGFSQLIGLLGTMAPWLLGRWISRAVLGIVSFLLVAAGIFLVALLHQPTAYIVGNLAMNLGYWAAMPLMLSVAADLDRDSGRLVAFMLGMSSIGLAIGPSLAGPLLGGQDTTLGGWVFGLIGLLAAPCIVVPAMAGDRAAQALRDQEAA